MLFSAISCRVIVGTDPLPGGEMETEDDIVLFPLSLPQQQRPGILDHL